MGLDANAVRQIEPASNAFTFGTLSVNALCPQKQTSKVCDGISNGVQPELEWPLWNLVNNCPARPLHTPPHLPGPDCESTRKKKKKTPRSQEKPSEPKTGTARTIPCTNRNRTKPNHPDNSTSNSESIGTPCDCKCHSMVIQLAFGARTSQE